jgi:class 3 adenylate cyclase
VGRGDAVTAAAPSGVVTFLFTDVEGSTRRWETDADGMRAALAAHGKGQPSPAPILVEYEG